MIYRLFVRRAVFPTCSPSTFLKCHYISKLIFPEVQHQHQNHHFHLIFIPSIGLARPKCPGLAFPFSRPLPAPPFLKRHYMPKLQPSNPLPLKRIQPQSTALPSPHPSSFAKLTASYLQTLFFFLIYFNLLLNNPKAFSDDFLIPKEAHPHQKDGIQVPHWFGLHLLRNAR